MRDTNNTENNNTDEDNNTRKRKYSELLENSCRLQFFNCHPRPILANIPTLSCNLPEEERPKRGPRTSELNKYDWDEQWDEKGNFIGPTEEDPQISFAKLIQKHQKKLVVDNSMQTSASHDTHDVEKSDQFLSK